MQLSRRDAIAALSAIGGGAFAGCALPGSQEGRDGGAGDHDAGVEGDGSTDVDADRIRDTLVAVAETVYPSAVSGIPPFVETFLEGRLDDPAHAVGLSETVTELNELAEGWYGGAVPALSPSDRDALLREVGADEANGVPDGRTAERVRYFVVDELLLALYASPTGGELVGIENPPGHPGGIESYQRGPGS